MCIPSHPAQYGACVVVCAVARSPLFFHDPYSRVRGCFRHVNDQVYVLCMVHVLTYTTPHPESISALGWDNVFDHRRSLCC